MHHRATLLSSSLSMAALFAFASPGALAAELHTVRNPVPGQYIVVLKPEAASLAGERGKAARVSAVAGDIAGRHRAKVVRSYDRVLRGFVARADDRALARLLADPRVAYVEEDGRMSVQATQTSAPWGLDRIDQRALPLNGTYVYDTTASGVHAYIIDTGILLAHSQFSGRVGNGFDAVTSGGNANDCHGHGTHVAGTVGGTTYGVAKGVTLHPVRVLDCGGSGTNSGVIAGMDWVTANRVLPAVANMSLGGGASQSVDDAVARMTTAGVTVVAAAGNSGYDACGYSPARAPAAITVGATNSQDARATFSVGSSNFGTCLDIFAPGHSILSAWRSSTTATNTLSGTSMAAPHVAGAAALYLANNPAATPAQVTDALVAFSTPNVVTNAGTGSPNRLLYTRYWGTPGVAPRIDGLACSAITAGGLSDHNCKVNYTSATPVTVTWSGGAGLASGDWYYGVCGEIQPKVPGARLAPPDDVVFVTVTARVTNAYGTASINRRLACALL